MATVERRGLFENASSGLAFASLASAHTVAFIKPTNCTFQDIVRGDAGVLADLLNDIRTAYVPNVCPPALPIFTF